MVKANATAVARHPVFASALKTGCDEEPDRTVSNTPRNQNGGKYRAAGKFTSTSRNREVTGNSRKMVKSNIIEMPCRKGEMAREKRSPNTAAISTRMRRTTPA